MDRRENERARGVCRMLPGFTIWFAALMLPPFFVLAIAPMLVLLVPIGMVVIPFIVPALFGGARTAHLEEQRRLSWRPAAARHARLWVVGEATNGTAA